MEHWEIAPSEAGGRQRPEIRRWRGAFATLPLARCKDGARASDLKFLRAKSCRLVSRKDPQHPATAGTRLVVPRRRRISRNQATSAGSRRSSTAGSLRAENHRRWVRCPVTKPSTCVLHCYGREARILPEQDLRAPRTARPSSANAASARVAALAARSPPCSLREVGGDVCQAGRPRRPRLRRPAHRRAPRGRRTGPPGSRARRRRCWRETHPRSHRHPRGRHRHRARAL